METVLQTKDLSFSYGKRAVLKQVSLSIKKGEIVSILGSNGSGKSTLMRCLAGLLSPQEGSVRLFGEPLALVSRVELAKQLGFLPQISSVTSPLSVEELVSLGRSPHHSIGWSLGAKDQEKIQGAIHYMKMEHLRKMPIQALSGGERQRAFIAMILAQDTPIVLLDEPSTYMDMKYQWELLAILHRLREDFGKTVVAIFHDVHHAMEVSDRFFLMKNGALYAYGKAEEVITEEILSAVFDTRIRVFREGCSRGCFVSPVGCREKNAG